ncbi:HpcH/HpaI aldolase family protein [Palleronia aestuarii]|nr:aldolase/citrate lyase family protein [Palleronia aestuarii]
MTRARGIARIAKMSGHDFLFIDTQHAPFSRESIADLIVAAEGVDIPALVRVRGSDDPDITLHLDVGAAGVILPNINSGEEAAHAVSLCRLPPDGRRSSAKPTAPGGDDDPLVVCMIETTTGVANADAIAAVPGVDLLHIGCVDLRVAMGVDPDVRPFEFAQAILQTAHAATSRGKLWGLGGERDQAQRAKCIANGARFMTTNTDEALLLSAATAAVASDRARY